VIACVKIFYHAAVLLKFRFFTPVKDLTKYGKWAVVTGATSGIGEAYAHYLAKKGINILLISRSEKKLQKVQNDLEEKYKVEVEYIIHDFSVADPKVVTEFRTKLDVKLGDLTSRGGVGVLINSVGVANVIPANVHEMNQEEIRQMMYINNDGTMLMMMAVVPHMMFRKTGAVISISSGSCTHPSGLLSVYSATKAFGNQLTRSMYYEYKEHGIDFLSITPYYFVSNLFKRDEGTFLAPMPEVIVKSSIKYLGYAAEANTYIGHKICEFLTFNFILGNELVYLGQSQARQRALRSKKKIA